jgi:hypothetical protein
MISLVPIFSIRKVAALEIFSHPALIFACASVSLLSRKTPGGMIALERSN